MTKSSAARLARRRGTPAAPIARSRSTRAVFTKYVEREFADDVAAGRVRIGTLAGYRATEAQYLREQAKARAASGAEPTDHRLSDTGEGKWSQKVMGKQMMLNKAHLGLIASNVEISTTGGPLIQFDTTVDCHAFCATKEPYTRNRHRLIKAKNSKLTHYVVFDLHAFQDAMEALQLIKNPRCPGDARYCFVKYVGERIGEIPAAEFGSRTDADQLGDAIRHKPLEFKHEQEIRFVLLGEDLSNAGPPILTKDFPSVAALIARAVISRGEWHPTGGT